MISEEPQGPDLSRRTWGKGKVVAIASALVLIGAAVLWFSTRLLIADTRSREGTSSSSSTSGGNLQESPSPGDVLLQGSPTPDPTPNTRDFALTSPTPGVNQSKGQMPLEVTIEPRCGSWGTTMIGKIVTSPRAHVNFAVAYPDGQAYGQFGIARADTEGNLTYAWTIPPSAAKGKGNFLVGSSHESEEKSAVGAWEFFIREVSEC